MRRIQGYITTQLAHYLRIDARYFFSGGVWLTLIQVISILGSLIVSTVLAATLDEQTFGAYRYILGIGAVLCSFSLTGMGQSIFQTASVGHTWFYVVGMKKSLIYSAGIVCASVIGAVYYFLQQNIELAIGCLLIALLQPLINTYQQIFPFLQGKKMFAESAKLQGIKTLVVTLTTLATVHLTQNVLWLVGTYLLVYALSNMVIHYMYRPTQVGPVDEGVYTRYMDYAWNTSIRNIVNILAFRIDSIIVFQQLGAADLAVYTIATILPEHIKGSFKNIITLLIPKYAQHENLESIKKSMLVRSIQLCAVFIGITILFIVAAPFIYALLFPKYTDAVVLTQILALSFPAMIALIPSSALQAQTAEKKLSKMNTSVSLFLILATFVLTSTHGILGAIIAKVITRYVNVCIAYYYLFQKDS